MRNDVRHALQQHVGGTVHSNNGRPVQDDFHCNFAAWCTSPTANVYRWKEVVVHDGFNSLNNFCHTSG